MFLDQFLDDRQAEAGPLGLGCNVGVEYLADLAGIEARPIILDFDLRKFDTAKLGGTRMHVDLRAGRLFQCFQGIAQQVLETLAQQVAGGGDQCLVQFSAELRDQYGHSIEGEISWSATGGSITNDGRYTAAYDGESFFGNAVYTAIRRDARTWRFYAAYRHMSPTFRVDNGFETRNDRRQVSMLQELSFYPSASWVDRISPRVYGRMAWDWIGQKKSDYLEGRTPLPCARCQR